MRAFALAAVVVSAACRPPQPAAPFTLRIAVTDTLAPVTPQAKGWTSVAGRLVFEPFLTFGEHGEVVPVVASRVENAPGGSLRLWLRTGARFSDGTAVTLDAITESLADTALQAHPDGDAIVLSTSEHAVPIELQAANAVLFRRAGDAYLGTAPFKVAEQDKSHILLDRLNPVPGTVAAVRFDSYGSPQESFARTLKGDADLLTDVEPRWLEFFEGVPRFRILRRRGDYVNVVAFNTLKVSRSERIAVARALASDELRTLAFGADCPPPDWRPENEPLDSGQPLRVLTIARFERAATAVRRSLGPRGGEERIVDIPDFLDALRKGDYELATTRPRVSPPILNALLWRTGASDNFGHYSNPAVDAAIDARDWPAMERALRDDPPGAFICTPPVIVIIDARIRNAELTTSFMESIARWEVAQ